MTSFQSLKSKTDLESFLLTYPTILKDISESPFYYNTTTHIIITRPVSKPTHKPVIIRPNKPTYRPNITVKPNTNVKTNINRNKSNKSRINIKRSPK